MFDRTTCYEALEEPQKRGQATEAIIQTAFILHDIPVFAPTYDSEPYDLVVEAGGQFHRIRCETAYRKTPGTIGFETVSTRRRNDGCDRRGDDSRAEYFAVYDPITDNRYLIPVPEAATGKMEIRFCEPNDGQCVGINWAEDYLLDEQLEELGQP